MPSEIVDRQRELRLLAEHADTAPALIVRRGRRRVGKSFLLRVAFSGHRLISLQAENSPPRCSSPRSLRSAHGSSLARRHSRSSAGPSRSPSLKGRPAGAALVAVLDEFRRIAAEAPGIESLVQNAWDRWDHDGVPVTLALSGSALSVMSGLFGGGKPTRGRSGYRPLLLPLGFRDVAPFVPADATAAEIIERFSVLGGTPQCQRSAGRRSLSRVLSDTILPPAGRLYDDPEHLVRKESGIREPAA